MTLVSSHWGSKGRIRLDLEAGVAKKLHGRTLNPQATSRTTLWGSWSSRAASFSPSAVVAGNADGRGRAWILRRGMQTRVRDVVPRAAALDGKGLQCGGEEGLFDKFLEHSVMAMAQFEDISPLPCQDEFRDMMAIDGQSVIKNVAFESTKLRLFRCATINGGENMQVLNVAICARPEYDLPIFCADFFSTPRMSIVVLDLNPLYNTEQRPDYKAKYYSSLLPLGNKYAELLPWGDKLTAESIQFFSPIVIWTRPGSCEEIPGTVFDAFKEYLAAWRDMAEKAKPSEDATEIAENQESHHRYLTWRATKDPGRFILMRLYGEEMCERYITEFLFNGVTTLGEKEFLDYFPEYRGSNGNIVKQRSVVGKAYAERPWNKDGVFANSLI